MNSRTLFVLLALLVGIGLVYPFGVSEYLKTGEDVTMVKYSDFIVDGTPYRFVDVNGTTIFILKGEEIVSDPAQIESLIQKHYHEVYFPKGADLDQIRSLALRYNTSRNDGTNLSMAFKNHEEDTCRKVLQLDSTIYYKGTKVRTTCEDDFSCNATTEMVCYYMRDKGLTCDTMAGWNWAYKSVRDFVYSSDHTTMDMDRIFYLLANLNDDNMVISLNEIKGMIPELKDYMGKLEKNIFRVPLTSKECPAQTSVEIQCMGQCPAFDLDGEALDSLDARITNVTTAVNIYAGYPEFASQLAKETEFRIIYSDSKDIYDKYYPRFFYLEKNITAMISKADGVLALINDSNLSRDTGALKAGYADLKSDFTDLSFENVDAEMSEMVRLVNKTNVSADNARAFYDSVVDVKDQTSITYYLLDSKELPQNLNDQFNQVAQDKTKLDAKFENGLSGTEFQAMKAQYLNISAKLSSIQEQQKEFIAMSSFRGFARKLNNGIYDIATSKEMGGNQNLVESSAMFPPVFSAVCFISLSALCVFIMLAFFPKDRPRNRMFYLLFFSVALVLLVANLVFSGMVFYYLDKTSNSADIKEFLLGMNTKQNVRIYIHDEGMTSTNKNRLFDCAKELSSVIYDNKKVNATIYSISDTKCTDMLKGKTMEMGDCAYNSEEIAINFHYTDTYQKPKFSAIFNEKADFYGNSQYYDRCDMLALFR
ncbi:MAG: hypothetical protein ACP5NX_01880 [Candidatus Bilamarchaeaceae archaeon]